MKLAIKGSISFSVDLLLVARLVLIAAAGTAVQAGAGVAVTGAMAAVMAGIGVGMAASGTAM
jgi:hypothetical protein